MRSRVFLTPPFAPAWSAGEFAGPRDVVRSLRVDREEGAVEFTVETSDPVAVSQFMADLSGLPEVRTFHHVTGEPCQGC